MLFVLIILFIMLGFFIYHVAVVFLIWYIV